jgi:undecaprenyl diphosphate synthase
VIVERTSVPTHLGIIMDGNGRWAKARNLPRTAGHIEGLKAVKRVIAACRDEGIRYLTMYVFSTENWKRSGEEVGFLMNLLASKLHGELLYFMDEHIRILVRGDITGLPEPVRNSIRETEEATKDNDGIVCSLAINYGGQDEIVRAVNKLIASGVTSVTAEQIAGNLDLPSVPPVDMIVRSAGERRISNFLLWDSAYAELASYDKLWPDWDKDDVQRICEEYAHRVRKFGGVLE